MTQNSRITLITPGSLVSELHYGPYSYHWWIISNDNQFIFPIRLGQKSKVRLNDKDFFITIKTGSNDTALLPVYCCQSGLHVITETSPTKAISALYKCRFNTSTRYSGYKVMGWNDENTLKILKEDIQFTPVNIKKLSGTSVAQIEPNRDKNNDDDNIEEQCNSNKKTKTIPGISKWFAWDWPINGNFEGYIRARSLPNIGNWKEFSPAEINTFCGKTNRPNPEFTTPTQSKIPWLSSLPMKKDSIQSNEMYNLLQNKNTQDQMTIDTVFPLKLGWALKENQKMGNKGGGKPSLIHPYEKKQSIFVSRFEEKKCIVEIYQESILKKQFFDKTPDEVWKKIGLLQKFTGVQLFGLDNPIIEKLIQQYQVPKCTPDDWNNEFILKQLFDYYVKRRTIANADWRSFFKTWNESENPVIELEPSLCAIYPSGYEFNDRELGAWKTMLHAIGATNITPWSQEESQHQLWTKSANGQTEKVIFATLYQRGFLISIPKNMPNTTQTFWKCFEQALANNPIIEKLIQQYQVPKCTPDDWNNEFILKQLFDYYVKRRTIANADWRSFFKTWNESENPVIELEPSLCAIYPSGYEFNDRELGAWKTMLHAIGATNITPWSQEESQHQLWTKSANGQTEKVIFATLYQRGFLISIPKNMPNTTQTFWKCFEQALAKLMQNLNVGSHTILESRKHACSNGYGAPVLVKPVIHKQRFTPEMLKQIENFLNYKEFVNMSSYKTDLQDTKKALLERFSEEYPNGIRRTSFMTCLNEGQFVYRENLGGLYSACNDCGYMIFGDIGVMISAHIMDNFLKKRLLKQSQELRRYIQRQYSKELEISTDGTAIHNSCIRALNEEHFETLDLYKQKLIAWMAHHARKTYLNIHVRTNLEELDGEDAIIIVDYKMKILPQSARETKAEFFGKRDAWYMASSLYTVFETINPKPKWVTIMSDNEMHYHCTELMLIIGKWKEWYNIIPRKWVFLEAGEAKTAINSHHAQISQAIKRYVKLGYDINAGDNIESAIKNIADKEKLGTITGISNYQEWTWPTNEENSGYIFARALPEIGEWKIWSSEKIKKIIKKRRIEKPNPTYSQHSNPILTDITNITSQEIVQEIVYEPSVKRMTMEVKKLLEIMFHSGTANPRQKFNAQQMHEELLRCAKISKIEKNKIPKVTTISNWITVFSRKWKEAMALRSLEENINLENL
ncbi:hypothetical protein Glove_109g253 [Diversispora epigaea]|uniref:Uncharacterized protein n=1 Tax=Diversispora epigaea TaxID=1348612 RepID=A0A397J1X3_9GLOM|nr:hypothetical protein Glove_109g253 [Diversispora epigaea]